MEQDREARWDYPGSYRQKIVPYPYVHLSFRGCFRPFLGAAISTITHRVGRQQAAGQERPAWVFKRCLF